MPSDEPVIDEERGRCRPSIYRPLASMLDHGAVRIAVAYGTHERALCAANTMRERIKADGLGVVAYQRGNAVLIERRAR